MAGLFDDFKPGAAAQAQSSTPVDNSDIFSDFPGGPNYAPGPMTPGGTIAGKALNAASNIISADPANLIPGHEGSWANSFENLIARTGARIAGAPLDLSALANRGGRYLFGLDKHFTMPPEMPSDFIIREAGIGMDPNAGSAMQMADRIAPFVIPTPGAASRFAVETPTIAGAIGNLARHAVGGALDYGASQAGAELAADAMGDTPGARIAGAMLGSGARPVAQRALGEAGRLALARPDAGEVFDAAQRQGITPTFGMLTGKAGQDIEKGLGAIPLVNKPITEARQNVLSQTEDALRRMTGVEDIQQPGDVAQGFIEGAQRRQMARRAEASAEQGAIESAIGPRTPTDVSPVLDVIEQRAGPEWGTGDPGVAEPFKANMRRQLPNLRGDIEAMNPGNTQARLDSLQAIEDTMRRNEQMRQDYLQRQQAAQGPVTLNPQQAADYVESLAGTLNPRELFQLQTRLQSSKFGGKGQLVVQPGDPGYASVAPAAPPAPNYLPIPAEVPLASTAGYGAIKDERSLLRQKLEGSPSLTAEHAQPYYDAYTESMREAAANTPAVGAQRFDEAMRDYARLQNEEVPWLSRQGGQPTLGNAGGPFEHVPDESTIVSRLRRAVGPNETFLQEAGTHIPTETEQAVANIVRGMGREGRVDPSIRPDRLATDLSTLNPTAVSMLPRPDGYVGPAPAMQAVQDLQTTGRAFGQPRDQASLSKAAGIGGLISKFATPVTLPIAALSSGALESAPVLRSMAGRVEYSPLVQQMLMRAGYAAQDQAR